MLCCLHYRIIYNRDIPRVYSIDSKMSQSLEAPRLGVYIPILLWNVGRRLVRRAVEIPAKFQNDWETSHKPRVFETLWDLRLKCYRMFKQPPGILPVYLRKTLGKMTFQNRTIYLPVSKALEMLPFYPTTTITYPNLIPHYLVMVRKGPHLTLNCQGIVLSCRGQIPVCHGTDFLGRAQRCHGKVFDFPTRRLHSNATAGKWRLSFVFVRNRWLSIIAIIHEYVMQIIMSRRTTAHACDKKKAGLRSWISHLIQQKTIL